MQYTNAYTWARPTPTPYPQLEFVDDPVAEIEADLHQTLSRLKFDEQNYRAHVRSLNEQYHEYSQRSSQPSANHPLTTPVPAETHSYTQGISNRHELAIHSLHSTLTTSLKSSGYPESQRAPFSSAANGETSEREAETKAKAAGKAKLCHICCAEAASIALIPCGHTGLCSACSRKLKLCPYCQQSITDTLVLQPPE